MLMTHRADASSRGHTAGSTAAGVLRQRLAVGAISFLTLVDLFAAQAILPSLAKAYRVSPATMGFAVNACTIGMAAAGLAVALAGHRIERRAGIVASLLLLSIPTALLALQPGIGTFTALRIAQGVCMSSAFTLTVAYLAEQSSAEQAAGAIAAYVSGNVASNLIGRLASAAVADHFGLAANFLVLAALNLAGAALVLVAFGMTPANSSASNGMRKASAWIGHLGNPPLAATFAIGFLILFAFIGVFTYVNFVLTQAPLSLSAMSLGLVYLVFLPALVLTPFAGRFAGALGPNAALRLAFAAAVAGLPLLLAPSLTAVLAGLALVSLGTFAAQAIATGFVSRLAKAERAAASGIYLGAYYLGGLAGSIVLGRLFEAAGWSVCVVAVGISLLLALVLTLRLPAARSSSMDIAGEAR